jgi:hypothetical protein
MKKTSIILFSVIAAVLTLASYTVYKTAGSHPGSTGAPGDLTCAQSGCHVTASVKPDSGLVNTLLFSSSDTTYLPGTTYTLTLKVAKSAISKFGFELVALKDSTNRNIGTFSLIESTRTQRINHVAAGGDLRYSMTHRTAGTGTAIAGAIQWRMKWTAPATNVGTITFWYASNCTNGNDQNTGDQVFLSHFRIRPFVPVDTTGGSDTLVTTGIDNSGKDLARLRAYQEVNSSFLSVNFSSYTDQAGKIMLFDASGKLLLSEHVQWASGHNMKRIDLPSGCCEGAYFVKVQADNTVYTNKILLEK